MMRLILIGVGVISTAIAGYIAKRKLARSKVEGCPVELQVYRSSRRPRRRKTPCSRLDEPLENGKADARPTA